MSRKKTQPKKNVVPDPKFNSTIIPKLINNIMYDGKRGVAAKIGYDAIDKEIELIKSRTDENAFIKGLDKTIEIKRKFQQDKNLERAESIFKRTPFGKDENFYAATIKVLSTKFQNSTKHHFKYIHL